MSDPVNDTRLLAETHGLKFQDCGGGHVQLSGHGVLVNYWPLSKRRSLHCPDTGRSESNCTPYDAVKICMQGAKAGMKPGKKPSANGPGPDVKLEPTVTNPAGLRHFYQGDVPPWDESLGPLAPLTESDAIRLEACKIEQRLIAARAVADQLDEITEAA